MFFKKIVTVYLIAMFILSGCAKSKIPSTVGPLPSSEIHDQEVIEPPMDSVKLDVIIPIFDPGLPENLDDISDENIWPELRRAEANRFAYKMKEHLEETEEFGAIRVTPDDTATGDVYILGHIVESTGEEVEIRIVVMDISGKVWLTDVFDHEVSKSFHDDLRNEGKDPYDPLFEEAAQAIVQELDDHSTKEREDLHYLTDLRFGSNFSDASFMQYMNVDAGQYTLTSKPSDEDPMLLRVRAIRVRDQLFIDGLQDNYGGFSEEMNESYLMWQKQSLFELQAKRHATLKSFGQAAGGILLIGLAVLAAIAGSNSDAVGSTSAGATGAILGGMAGTSLLSESFKTSAEAKVHRESLNELGQSVNMELAPQVIAFEKESVELTGDAKEQYSQWRAFLQKIYSEEMTPDIQL